MDSPSEIQQTEGGFTDAYRNAATAGSAQVTDSKSGINIDHRMTYKDPSMPLRERIAARVASSVQSIENPCCIDVACSTGTDLGLLAKALGDKPAQLHGVDLMEATLENARAALPAAKFAQGDVVALPYPDAHFDSVQTSRLLVHVPDFEKAIDEMIRVLKPGGLCVLSEGEMDKASVMLSNDDRLLKVNQALKDHVAKMCANPRVVSQAYRYILSHAGTQDVCIEPFSFFLKKPTDMMGPELTHERQFLAKLVSNGDLCQEDADYYLENATGPAAEEGNLLQLVFMAEIYFRRT
mmetsp:Transcript_22111/g.58552  ORF Transcript_22111/g.58552 Transcript_22111/m.58552 type:complete len:295 (-) Transcript_22111:218-1102(-)|eukprot:CAMPEP_0194538752 /NCGR_PEP_ID=MMETSP0253-20130528/78416_1 /TAXON_ID=2966 /ORGANISM="Noctiluca scintillans" /LENGTH=294 /DNA_ID=CAMNT_0039384925 /DNA_START=99 /DNA_END=983 /DNA_ORIENTATION=+